MGLLHYSPAPPRYLSTPFRIEVEKGILRPGAPVVHPVLILNLPAGVKRYGLAGIASAARGVIEPRIKSFGTISRGVDLRSDTLQSIEMGVEIADEDQAFSKLVAKYRNSLRGSVATVVYLSPNVPDVSAPVRFSGVVDSYSQVTAMTWRLQLRTDDRPLQVGVFPRGTINTVDWPNAHSDALGAYIPVIFGVHDSAGLSDEGMLPTYYVDTIGFRYLVGAGKVTVSVVYKDGIKVTSGYAITYPTVGGRIVTLIDFTADQTETASITCDVKGLTDTAETTGRVIENPARQLRILCNAFVWNDWRGGAYPTNAPLDETAFASAADFFDQHGYQGAVWYGGDSQIEALQAVEAWSTSHAAKLFWRSNGTLAVVPLEMVYSEALNLYAGLPVNGGDEGGAFTTLYDPGSLTKRLSLQAIYGQVEGKYFAELTVADQSVAEEVTVTRALEWSAARVV